MSVENVTFGLILAGGQSSRMGQDKARLQWQGVPLYRHMENILIKAGIHQTIISSNVLRGSHVIVDEVPGKGPLSGIHAVLNAIPDGSYLLVVPVDMPLLPSTALQQLMREQRTCCYQDYTLPLLLQITPELRRRVTDNIHSQNRRDYSLWKLHKAMQGQTLQLPESMQAAFGNANTPEEWQQCQAAEQPKSI